VRSYVWLILVACGGHGGSVGGDAGSLDAAGDTAATDAATVAPTDGAPVGPFGQQAYLKASNTAALAGLGSSIAISADGSTLAVGANGESSNATGVGGNQTDRSAANSGAVYIFVRSGTTWSQQAYVKASNTEASDLFGTTVALSADGSTLAVGAPLESSAATGIGGDQADNTASLAGAVYTFARTGNAWSQTAYLKASNSVADDEFGDALALSGDGATLAVSAFGDASAATGIGGNQADRSATDAGAIYVFVKAGASWTQQAYVKASNTDAFDIFGTSVALDGDGRTMVVGAAGEKSGVVGNQADNSKLNAGAAYVFTRSGTAWSQQAYLKASNPDVDDEFGTHVAIAGDGSTLVVSSPTEQSAATGIDGNQADNSAIRAGAAYVFARTGTAWAQQAYLKASNTDASDQFGGGLAITGDGSTLAIGASGEASAAKGLGGNQADNSAPFAGAVYLMHRTGTSWSQSAYIKASNTDGDDDFCAPALSSDGSTLAVTAYLEDSHATGIDGDQTDNSVRDSGAVYVFHP